jgi:hypothetical protein
MRSNTAAWTSRARLYDSIFAAISTQAIDETLKFGQSGGNGSSMACGTGHLVAAASEQGAISQGVDFLAETMIDMARKNYPQAIFEFQMLLCCLSRIVHLTATCVWFVTHMENPQVAVNEAFRSCASVDFMPCPVVWS